MTVKLDVKKVLEQKERLQTILEDEVLENTEKFHKECLLSLCDAMPRTLTSKQKNRILEEIYATDGTISYIHYEVKVHINKSGFKRTFTI